jgi:hypothetical protein
MVFIMLGVGGRSLMRTWIGVGVGGERRRR